VDRDEFIQIGVRVPESWIVRLDKIAKSLSQPGARVTRSEALRIVAHRGMLEIENEKQRMG
jgi:hypothetical protein